MNLFDRGISTTATRPRLYEPDGAQVAKHVRRAQHAVPLQQHEATAQGETAGAWTLVYS